MIIIQVPFPSTRTTLERRPQVRVVATIVETTVGIAVARTTGTGGGGALLLILLHFFFSPRV